jgi:hypothetical protein
MRSRALRVIVPALTLATVTAACGGSGGSNGVSTKTSGTALVGTFHLTPGTCHNAGSPTGSYFRMIDRGGTVKHGKYFHNPDSPCKDTSYSVQTPGTKGGLITGSYQPSPATPFDAKGNSLADQIAKPGTFTAIKFGVETDPVDPQTRQKVPAPAIYNDHGKLTGNFAAFSASWNNQYFNQGSPKPDGSYPGLTTPVSGTYNAKTGAFVITWSSQIQGGAFDGFGGYWHLQGHFTPSA